MRASRLQASRGRLLRSLRVRALHSPEPRLRAFQRRCDSGEADANSSDGIEAEDMIEPGQICPTCERRVNHPRKHDSPDTVVFSYRAPADEADAHKEVLEATAKHLGTSERPHERFWTLTYALAAVLQDESLRGMGQRSPVA